VDADQRPGPEGEPPLEGELTIQQASRLLEVPAPTIRSWERRYGIPQANRSHGGHRRYTPEQVRLLRRMRDAIAQGQPAMSAAALVRGESSASEPVVEAFLRAAHRLDPVGVRRVLDSSNHRLGLGRTIDEVLFPAMQQIGRDWQVGRCDVAHEHLATESARAWLAQLADEQPARTATDEMVLLACGPRDYHTLGVDAMAALLRQRGRDCRVLGACTPVESLFMAVRELAPAAVVLVSHMAVARRSAIEALRVARRGHAHLFYAGNAFASRQARNAVPGTYLGNSLRQAADLVTSTISDGAGWRREVGG
jgi:DNA-binding transcriptional MerR regulator